ncbi:Ribonuclease H-like domain containing protein [Tylopilus felleus]
MEPGSEEPISGRPKRTAAPSAKLRDSDNAATPELRSHQQAQHAPSLADPTLYLASTPPSDSRSPSPALPIRKRKNASQRVTISIDDSADEQGTRSEVPSRLSKGSKRVRTNATTNDGTTSATRTENVLAASLLSIEVVPSSSLPQDETGMDGLLKDVDFFAPTYSDENGKKMRTCKKCSKASHPVSLVAEITTLRRHLESHHKAEYLQWAEGNGFTSMLPKDAKQRTQKQSGSKQGRLDGHLQPIPIKENVTPYSDELFCEAAIRVPISTLKHPSFKNMINVASRTTTGGVTIPNRKATRKAIIDMFITQMRSLRSRLLSNTASNTDAYFAVTGSWVEEKSSGVWDIHTALLGFTRLNSAHNGVRLGQALYKITAHLAITHKIGHVTCDNASNMDTMMSEFAKHIELTTGKLYDGQQRRVRESKAYNPKEPDADLIAMHGTRRDEVGVVRTICEIFQKIQLQAKVNHPPRERPLQLLLDMPVHWSSTYLMLERADHLKDDVDSFIHEIAAAERDQERRQKLMNLQLTDDEYSLEALHKAWHSRSLKVDYVDFRVGLEAGVNKIAEYYEKSADSDVYIMAMHMQSLLDPVQKAGHIRCHWGKELCDEAIKHAEGLYKARYLELKGDVVERPKQTTKTSSAYGKIGQLLCTLSDDDDDDDADASHATPSTHGDLDPHQPWLEDFHGYLRSKDQLQANMTIIQWWGLNTVSERAFSSTGITIAKHRNHLKPDIVEALQCLKCMIRRDLLFREDPLVLLEVGISEESELISGLDEVDEGDEIAITMLD